MAQQKNNKRLLIIDIESYIYKACGACRELAEITPFVYQEIFKLENGIDFINDTIKDLKVTLNADDYVLVLGSDTNFRKEINPDYKAQRGSKPLLYPLLRDYVLSTHPYVILDGLEADDVARIICEDKVNYDSKEKIIVSIDKDFYTVPCKFYRDINNCRQVIQISKEEANYNLMEQVITGDSADNYSGIPGWGKSKAKRWLNEKKRTWADVKELYKENGLTEEDYKINKRMAQLVGYYEYDFEKGEVIDD